MTSSESSPSPLLLLIRVNMLTLWRRLKSISEQSRLLSGVTPIFVAGYLVLAYWMF